MDNDQIFEMAIREMTENALEVRRNDLPKTESELYFEVGRLDRELKSILTELSVKQRKVIEDFIDKKEWIADKECLYLYIQGAKDVIALLKKLGVF